MCTEDGVSLALIAPLCSHGVSGISCSSGGGPSAARRTQVSNDNVVTKDHSGD